MGRHKAYLNAESLCSTSNFDYHVVALLNSVVTHLSGIQPTYGKRGLIKRRISIYSLSYLKTLNLNTYQGHWPGNSSLNNRYEAPSLNSHLQEARAPSQDNPQAEEP